MKPLNIYCIRQQSCEKVMFSVVCVCLSVCLGDPHVTITHVALDLNPPAPPQP